MKKVLIPALLYFMLAGVLPVSAVTMRDTLIRTYTSAPVIFSDLKADHANFVGISFLVEEEAIKGYPDGTFKPDGAINRAELMKMVVAMFASSADLTSYQNCFSDVGTEWFASYVCFAKEKGWVDGYPDGTFQPAKNVNRVEAMKIVLNAMIEETLWPTPTEAELQLPMPTDADNEAWYAGYLRFAVSKELLDGTHVTGDTEEYYYKPADPMTRKEVAEMIWRTYLYMVERIEYVDLIAETKCFQQAHADLSDEAAKALWIEQILTPVGYTESDVDTLSETYITDDVLAAMREDAVAVSCGDATKVDMSRWDGFKIYAR